MGKFLIYFSFPLNCFNIFPTFDGYKIFQLAKDRHDKEQEEASIIDLIDKLPETLPNTLSLKESVAVMNKWCSIQNINPFHFYTLWNYLLSGRGQKKVGIYLQGESNSGKTYITVTPFNKLERIRGFTTNDNFPFQELGGKKIVIAEECAITNANADPWKSLMSGQKTLAPRKCKTPVYCKPDIVLMSSNQRLATNLSATDVKPFLNRMFVFEGLKRANFLKEIKYDLHPKVFTCMGTVSDDDILAMEQNNLDFQMWEFQGESVTFDTDISEIYDEELLTVPSLEVAAEAEIQTSDTLTLEIVDESSNDRGEKRLIEEDDELPPSGWLKALKKPKEVEVSSTPLPSPDPVVIEEGSKTLAIDETPPILMGKKRKHFFRNTRVWETYETTMSEFIGPVATEVMAIECKLKHFTKDEVPILENIDEYVLDGSHFSKPNKTGTIVNMTYKGVHLISFDLGKDVIGKYTICMCDLNFVNRCNGEIGGTCEDETCWKRMKIVNLELKHLKRIESNEGMKVQFDNVDLPIFNTENYYSEYAICNILYLLGMKLLYQYQLMNASSEQGFLLKYDLENSPVCGFEPEEPEDDVDSINLAKKMIKLILTAAKWTLENETLVLSLRRGLKTLIDALDS